MLHAFVTGITGLIGREFVRVLLTWRRGVVGTARNEQAAPVLPVTTQGRLGTLPGEQRLNGATRPLAAIATDASVPGPPRSGPARFWVWVLAATVLAAGLRLWRLDEASFWIDEIYSVRTCIDPTQTHRSKMFGYLPTYAGLWLSGVDPSTLDYGDSSGWREAGVTEWTARIGSCVVGILSVPLLMLASRAALGTAAACLFGLMLAANPWHIYWSQAARFYTLEFLFFGLSLALYFTATERGGKARFAAAMLCMILAFLSQPPAAVIGAIFAADWLYGLARGRPVRLGAFGWAVGIAAAAFCAAVLWMDMREAPDQWSRFVSFNETRSSHPPLKFIAGIVYTTGPALAVAAVSAAWVLRKSRPRLSAYLAFAAAIPMIGLALWSVRNAVGTRYAFVCLYGWVALAALGLAHAGRVLHRTGGFVAAATPTGVVLAASSVMLLSYYTTGHGFHPRWREAFDVVKAELRAEDTVCCRHPLLGSFYLGQGAGPAQFLPANHEELDAMGGRVWLVVQIEGVGQRDMKPWIDPLTELKASLDLRVTQPEGLVRVLLYDPDDPRAR